MGPVLESGNISIEKFFSGALRRIGRVNEVGICEKNTVGLEDTK